MVVRVRVAVTGDDDSSDEEDDEEDYSEDSDDESDADSEVRPSGTTRVERGPALRRMRSL
jgi:hypothetical protein